MREGISFHTQNLKLVTKLTMNVLKILFSCSHVYPMLPYFTWVFRIVHGALFRIDPDVTIVDCNPTPSPLSPSTHPQIERLRARNSHLQVPRPGLKTASPGLSNSKAPGSPGQHSPFLLPHPHKTISFQLGKTKLHLLMKELEPQGFLSLQAGSPCPYLHRVPKAHSLKITFLNH